MGYEYSSQLDSTREPASWSDILKAVEALDSVVIVERSHREVVLRLSEEPRSGNTWNEDARLSFADGELYIVFHSASGGDRDRILRDLALFLERQGLVVAWEEL